MCYEVKLLTGPVIIEKGRSFYGAFKITDIPVRPCQYVCYLRVRNVQ